MHPLLTTLPHALTTLGLATTGTDKPGGNGKGKNATNKPDPTDKTRTGNGNGDTADSSEGLLQTISGLLWDNPIAIPILLLAALIGIQYGWKQLRNKQAARGVALRPLGAILRDVLKFAIKEDKRPVHTKTPGWFTGSRLYATLFVLSVVAIIPGIPGIPTPIIPLILLITLSARYTKIAKARRGTLNQMYAVATAECRYAKGSEMSPWNYVQISTWINLIQPGKTVINIPAAYQSEDMKTREKFERNFNGTVSEENAWTYKWESAKNRLVCEPAAFLPQMAPYPGPGPKWNEIPIGIMGDGTQATMPFDVAPHALICGPTGSGKSVLQRMILFHVLAHSDTWRIVAIDMKKVEMTWLRKYPSVLKVATDLEESVEVLRSLRAEMMRRYEEMEQQGVNHAKDLPDPPKAILCMIDETTVLLAIEGIKSDEGKERDELHAEAQMIIGELGRLSRASMIHVAMCFQRPDAKFLSGEIKANFDMRIAAGRMDTTPSLMVLDSEAANRLPKVKGRGMIRVGGELDTFQGYFAEQGWYDEWVLVQQGGSPDADGGAGEPVGALDGPDADSDGGPDGSMGVEEPGRPARGFKALAAKAAAKAEARAARMDAEEVAEDDGADGPEDAPEAPSAPVVTATKGRRSPITAPVTAPVPSPTDDLGAVLGAPPAAGDYATYSESDDDLFDDEDMSEEFDDEFDLDLDDEPDVDEFDAAPDSVPVPPVVAARPVVPKPVAAKPGVYQPGAALPSVKAAGPAVRPAGAPVSHPVVVSAPPTVPAPPSVPAPVPEAVRPTVGIPVQRPSLPTRPPSSG